MASRDSTLSMVSTYILGVDTALLICLLFLPGSEFKVEAQKRKDEVDTLLSFKTNTRSFQTSGYWITWTKSADNACAWVGVTCTNNYTVWQLDFSGWFVFDGDLPPSFEILSTLRDLRELDLSGNNLRNMPEGIGTLTRITRLDLSRNPFFLQDIPANISSCRSLRFLSLQQNGLMGEIPSLRGLVNLQYLLLADNFLSGPFPIELGELRRLAIVDLSNNSLNGTIPALPNLSNLVELKLDNNYFTGFEESWSLGPNSSLQHLSVSFNLLEGMIPSNITSLLNLESLDLSGNRLSGNIPYGFSQQYKNAFVLDLSQNQLTGKIPVDMLQQPLGMSTANCASVNVSINLLVGDVPIDGAKSFCFNFLDLSHNSLSGLLPVNIFTSADNFIEFLWLHNNHLSGDIVEVMVQGLGVETCFYRTQELRVQNNLFTGDLSKIADTDNTNLQVLDLSNNKLQWKTSKAIRDPITATLKQLTSTGSLTEFRAAGNDFSGTSLPSACFVSQDGYNVYNQFNVLDLSNNHLTGEILSDAFNRTCLPFLHILDLSSNNISGQIPEAIISLDLAKVDLSNNNLSGPLPHIPQNSSLFIPSVFAGNSELCGSPLSACFQAYAMRSIQWWLLLIIIGGAVTVASGSCVIATWRWRVYRKRHQQDEDLIKTLMGRDAATLMSLRELRKATGNFAESAKIGQGGFGIVYKGKLNNGTIVAIKRSQREGSEKDKEQFLNEVRILSQVSHRNLVKLLGCCMENKISLLVFEFVSNGTLQEHLEGKIGAVRLSWKQRLNIAVQTADALNYLHSAAKFPIYHRDVKSANILLNDELNTKVADFGISKLADLQATHVSTVAVQGTFGYIDPEYYNTRRLTDKSDVYSFGVVLLELISAKPAIDISMDGERTSLVHFSGPHIERGNLTFLIDTALMETYNDSAGYGKESMINVGRLAMKCLAMQSKARPTMSEVLNELKTLWLELNGRSKQMDSIIEDDYEYDSYPSYSEDDMKDPQHHDIFLLSKSFSGDSSSSTLQIDDSGIQMSEFFSRQTLRSKSMF